MNRKRRSSVRPQQKFYQYLESLEDLEMHERPQHHESEIELSGDRNNITATELHVSLNRPTRIGVGTCLVIANSFHVLAASLTFLS